jgi:hypothetical protein
MGGLVEMAAVECFWCAPEGDPSQAKGLPHQG